MKYATAIYASPLLMHTSFATVCCLALVAARVQADEVPLHGTSVLRFATLSDAQTILGARDRFVAAMSPFDRQSRIETDREVSDDEFLQFATSQAREWKVDEIAKVSSAVKRLRDKLGPFKLPFPANVLLVQTSGREEGGAAYCRGNAVILPRNLVAQPDEQLERLLTHELFHILSSHNSAWRNELYKTIGFQSIPAIELPISLKARKITNPDAPLLDAYITLDVDGETVFATPVLYAKSERFDVKQGGPFFRYLTFRLMVVEQTAGKWLPVVDAGEPRMLEPGTVADYKRQIGGNTQYIIHPDEILADNFVHLIQKTSSVPSPKIVDALRNAISKNERQTR